MAEQDFSSLFTSNPLEFTPDPEMAAREQLLWNKINKGPRERAKELAAEEWKNRYGITESSGKGRRILGGLGELFRGIAQGSKYESISDKAAAQGMKEYQAEVGPLQRELGVLSQAKSAALKALSQQQIAQEKNAVEQYKARIAGAKTLQEAEMIKALTPERVKKLAAETENLTANTGLTNEKTNTEAIRGGNLLRTFGLNGQAGLTAAMSPDSSPDGIARTWGDMQALKAALAPNKGSSGGTTTTTRQALVDGPNGKEIQDLTSTSTRSGKTQAPLTPESARQISQQFFGNRAQPLDSAATPSPTITQSPTSGPVEFRQLPSRGNLTEFHYFDGKKYVPTNIHPTQESVLKAYKGDKQLPEWLASRFRAPVIPGSQKKTIEDIARSQFNDAASELLKSASTAYGDGKLEVLTGPGQNFMAKIKGMQSNGLTLGDVKTRADAVNAMALKILELSGKAVSDSERRILSTPLPDLGMDSDTTLLYKAMLTSQVSRRLQYMKAMKLNDAEMEALKNAAEPDLKKNISMQLNVLSALNKSAKLGVTKGEDQIEIPIPGSKGGLKTTRQKAQDLLRQLSQKDFTIFTDKLKTLGN